MSILDVTEKRKKAGLFLEVSLHYHNVFGWLYYIMSTIFIFYKRYRYLELGEWIRSFELVVQVGFFGIAHLLYILSGNHVIGMPDPLPAIIFMVVAALFIVHHVYFMFFQLLTFTVEVVLNGAGILFCLVDIIAAVFPLLAK